MREVSAYTVSRKKEGACMLRLNLAQRKVLTLNNEFYGSRYHPSVEGNSDQHVLSHKMCHLLKYIGINPGSYVFSLDRYGAYSEGLQADMLRMDYDMAGVQRFYEDFNEEQVFSGDWRQGGLFSKNDKERVAKLAKQLGVLETAPEERRRWMELLSTLAELRNSVIPGASRKQIVRKLRALKSERNYQTDEIQDAWTRLEESGIFLNKEGFPS